MELLKVYMYILMFFFCLSFFRNNTECPYLCMGRPNNQFACLCPQGMKVCFGVVYIIDGYINFWLRSTSILTCHLSH